MNLKRFNLQLFADGSQDEESHTQTNNPSNGTKPSGNANEQGGKDDSSNNQKVFTEEELNAIIDKRYARWQAQANKQANQAQKYQQLTSDEKVKELEKQIQELNHKQAKSEMMKTARNDLREKQIDLDDDLLDILIVSDDAVKTKANIDKFAQLFEKAVESRVKNTLKGNAPKVKTGNITKEDIMKVKDRKERQRLIKENIDLFK